MKDTRFLKFMKGMLQAGYLEDWKYHQTYSGTPQGGICTPRTQWKPFLYRLLKFPLVFTSIRALTPGIIAILTLGLTIRTPGTSSMIG